MPLGLLIYWFSCLLFIYLTFAIAMCASWVDTFTCICWVDCLFLLFVLCLWFSVTGFVGSWFSGLLLGCGFWFWF